MDRMNKMNKRAFVLSACSILLILSIPSILPRLNQPYQEDSLIAELNFFHPTYAAGGCYSHFGQLGQLGPPLHISLKLPD